MRDFLARAILVAVLSLSEGCGSRDSREPIRIRGDLVPFGFCFGKAPPGDVVATSRALGFPGLGLTGFDSSELVRYAGLPEVVSGKFRIHSALWWTRAGEPVDTLRLDGALREAAKMDVALWMVLSGVDKKDKSSGSMAMAMSKYALVARHCRAAGVRLVLYPHAETLVESLEESLVVLDSLAARGYPDVLTSIHVCHEAVAGNGSRLPELVAKAGSRLALVSINGVGISPWGILPLDRGRLDLRPFLRALEGSGYKGPVELHTYMLPGPGDPSYDGHLERSLAAWKRMLAGGAGAAP